MRVAWKHRKSESEIEPLLAAADRLDPELRGSFPRSVEVLACAMLPVAFESHAYLRLSTVADLLQRLFGVECDELLAQGDEELAGYVFARGGHAVIFSDPQYGEGFERFTRAHEAAHLVIEYLPAWWRSQQPLLFGGTDSEKHFFACRDPRQNIFLGGRVGSAEGSFGIAGGTKHWLREVVANACAAELLAPYREIARVAAEATPEDDLVELVRARFGLSRRAAEIRLIDLGILDTQEEWLWLAGE
jgi:hypothetical protein